MEKKTRKLFEQDIGGRDIEFQWKDQLNDFD